MQLLDRAYNRTEYLQFLAHTFQFSPFLLPIPIHNNDVANFEQLGFINIPHDKKLLVFEIHIKPNTKLARNRVQLRNLVAKQIVSEDGALAVYVDDKAQQWRFSFISIEWELSSEGIRKEQTSSKRFTYLLGENTQTRTAKERFGRLSSTSTLGDLKAAFAVEPLTNEFYKQLYRWYEKAKSRVSFPNDERAKNHNETSLIRLLTRLLFVWFLKEKGLINKALFNEHEVKTLIHYNEPSSFYKAILQNLFFATLNRPIHDRDFRSTDKKTDKPNSDSYLVDTIYRYQNYFIEKDSAKIIDLFTQTPFLNGGLFECLDRDPTHEEEAEYDRDSSIRLHKSAIRIEGFSDRTDNELHFSNELFFNDDGGDEGTGDNAGDPGIIDIFKQYQFTVEESTPLDVEVALDPELLGKVFENLLASYNPETNEQARKATGSFYTPREIVNYMVDESLKAYLIQTVPPHDGDSEFYTQRMDDLFNTANQTGELPSDKDNDSGSPLIYPEEISDLIKAISQIKILDPAVGSGAFPMGALQRMVSLLAILDPDNKKWREQKLAELPDLQDIERDLKTSEKLGDNQAREKAQGILHEKEEKIRSAFAQLDHDYLRKLYLIENCMYGVDIQPIAIQIAKLRFFISLAIEQSPHSDPTDNYGITALPNLETKLIAANSLIPLGAKPETAQNFGLFDDTIKTLQKQLEEVRHKHFNAKTRSTKTKYRKKDRALRREASKTLNEDASISPEVRASMQKIVDWDLYNPDAVADWFDPEWQFGVTDGFDIVMGNPPYIRQENIKEFKAQFKQYFSIFVGTADIYTYFYERGFDLLSATGHLCYITSNKWMRAKYGEKLRRFFKHETHLKQIIDFEGKQIFENATVDTNILLCGKAANNDGDSTSTEVFGYQNRLPDSENPVSTMAVAHLSDTAFTLQPAAILSLKKKIEATGTPLKDWNINIYRGIVTGFNDAFIIDTAKKNELVAQDPKSAEIIKPILRGRDIKAYEQQWAGLWIIFIPWHFPLHTDKSIQGASKKAEREFQKRYPIIYNHLLKYKERLSKRNREETNIRYEWYALQRCANTYYAEFAKEKIIYPNMTKFLPFIYDEESFLINDKGFILTGKNLKYLTAYLNSTLFKAIFKNNFPRLGDGRELRKVFFQELPIPKISETEQQPFIALVNKIISAKQEGKDSTALEDQVDTLVYQLYGLSADEIGFVEGAM